MSNCELCGEPMPEGETMFKYHGYSGPCPKPPLPKPSTDDIIAAAYKTFRDGFNGGVLPPEWDKAPIWVRDAVKAAYMQGSRDAATGLAKRPVAWQPAPQK